MAQQPNIEIGQEALPPADLDPAPPRRWKPDRPGDIVSPEQMRWGGAFGRPGPDTGWALRLVAEIRPALPADESPELEMLIATMAAARASLFGRAPVPEDIEVALILLGLEPEGIPDQVASELEAGRRKWLKHAAHEKSKGRALLSALPRDVLSLKPLELRHRLVVEGLRA